MERENLALLCLNPRTLPDPTILSDLEHISALPPTMVMGLYTSSRAIGPLYVIALEMLSDIIFSQNIWLSGLIPSSGMVCYSVRGNNTLSERKGKTMKTLIGLALTGSIGSIVINNLIGLVATIQQTLNTVGL